MGVLIKSVPINVILCIFFLSDSKPERHPSLLSYEKTEDLYSRERLEIANKRLIKVRAERFKKANSTPHNAPIETLVICNYCRKKCLQDNKNKETFVPSTKEFNKNLFVHGAISYQVESLNSHFESEGKNAKKLPEMFY